MSPELVAWLLKISTSRAEELLEQMRLLSLETTPVSVLEFHKMLLEPLHRDIRVDNRLV